MLNRAIESVRRRVGDSPASRTVLKTGGTALAIKVGGAALAYGAQVVLARLLGGTAYGQYIYALAWAQLVMLVGLLGQDTAGLRFVGAYLGEDRPERLRGFVRFSRALVGAAALLAALLFLVTGHLMTASSDPALRRAVLAAACLVPIGCLLQWHAAILRGLQRVVIGMLTLEIWRPLGIMVAALLVFAVGRYWPPTAAATLGLNLAVTILLVIVLALALRRALPVAPAESSAALRREWAVVALSMMLMSGMHMVLTRVDLLMIGARLGPEAAGVYGAVSRTAVLVVFCVLAVNSIAAPTMARLFAAGQRGEFRTMATWATWAMVGAAVPVAVLLILFGPHILGLFGPGFAAGYPALIVFAAGQVLHAVFGLAGFMTTMTGHERFAAQTLVGAVVLNIGLNLALIPVWGLVGAAVATNVSKLLWNLVLVRYLKRTLGVDWWDLIRGRYLTAGDIPDHGEDGR